MCKFNLNRKCEIGKCHQFQKRPSYNTGYRKFWDNAQGGRINPAKNISAPFFTIFITFLFIWMCYWWTHGWFIKSYFGAARKDVVPVVWILNGGGPFLFVFVYLWSCVFECMCICVDLYLYQCLRTILHLVHHCIGHDLHLLTKTSIKHWKETYMSANIINFSSNSNSRRQLMR